jgi:hypothetical protein
MSHCSGSLAAFQLVLSGSVAALRVKLPSPTLASLCESRSCTGEPQGNVFGAREHECGGYKGLQKYGDPGCI